MSNVRFHKKAHLMPTPIEHIQRQAGELLALRLLVGAIAQQVPNIAKLIQDFSEMSEDSTVRTMYAAMPEPFFQELQTHRKVWVELLADISASR